LEITRQAEKNGVPDSSASESDLDVNIVQKLMVSISQVGQLSDAVYCKQHPGVVLLGRHRTEAQGGLSNVKAREFDVHEFASRVGIPHEVGEIAVRIHGDTQRKVKKQETEARVFKAARLLEASGVPKEKISKRLSVIIPFSPSYITRLLPREYKQASHAVSPGRPKRSTSSTVYLGKQNTSMPDLSIPLLGGASEPQYGIEVEKFVNEIYYKVRYHTFLEYYSQTQNFKGDFTDFLVHLIEDCMTRFHVGDKELAKMWA